MKLQLKHLAPYLPFDLNCNAMGEVVEGTEYDNNPIPKILTIISATKDCVTVSGIRKTINEEIMMIECFPILRPLSMLDDEIEFNGEKFIPIDWLEEKYYTLGIHKECEKLMEKDGFKWVNHMSYLLVLHLLEWHFDIFGLLDEKLAYPKNI